MPTHLFRSPISLETIDELLEACGDTITDPNTNETCKKVNRSVFNRMVINDTLVPFCDKIRDFYYPSQNQYAENAKNYKGFLTMVRQLCRACNIYYISKSYNSRTRYDTELLIFI